MELHQLRILRELADLGSVNAVAKSLYVSPSAVSQHLAQLQRNFPAPLTQKEGRRLVLTAEGKMLASAAARVASTLAEATAKIRTQEQDRDEPIRIAGFHSNRADDFCPTAHLSGRPVASTSFFR